MAHTYSEALRTADSLFPAAPAQTTTAAAYRGAASRILRSELARSHFEDDLHGALVISTLVALATLMVAALPMLATLDRAIVFLVR